MNSPSRSIRLIAGTAAVALAFGLAACGSSGDDNSDSPTSAAADAASDAAEPADSPAEEAQEPVSGDVTEIQWWAYGPVQPVADQYIAAFEAANPDVHVVYKLIDMETYNEALRPALMSDAGPDVFTESPGQRFDLFNSFATDLTDAFVAQLGADWQDQISAIGITGLSKDGKQLAAPVGADAAGNLWINKDLFDQYGLTPPTTAEEWKSVCDQFKANNVGCFFQGAQAGAFNQDTFQSIANSIEPGLYYKAINGEAEWTTPNLVLAFERWKWMFDEGIMQDGALGVAQYPEGNNAFLSGKYAMVQMGSWYMQNTRLDVIGPGAEAAGKTDGPFTILPIDFPIMVEGGVHPPLYGDTGGGLSVNAKGKNIEAATRFALFMGATEAGQNIVADMMTNIPSMKSVIPDYASFELVDPASQVPALEDMLVKSTAASEPRHILNADLETALWEALSMVAAGESSPADAAATLQGEAASLGIFG